MSLVFAVLVIGEERRPADAFKSLRRMRRIINADLPPPKRGVHT